MDNLDITEKLLKDSFARRAPLSPDITLVSVDLRKDTHDIINVYIRGMPVGQLVTDKTDSVTVTRRLLPESLKYGKEPSTLVRNVEELATAYGVLLLEVYSALNHGSVDGLRAFVRKLNEHNHDGSHLPGDGHLYVRDRKVRVPNEGTQVDGSHVMR